MWYRRVKIEGGTYFFTVVTYNRQRFLCQPENVELLRNAFRYVMLQHPFKIDAFVLLPEHLHCIWTLPQGDDNFSTRWRLVKSYFSRHCESQYRGYVLVSREKKKSKLSGNIAFGNMQFEMMMILPNTLIIFIITQ
jgi:putative transposase